MRLEVETQLLQPLALERVHHGVIPGGDVDFERGIDLAQVVQERQELDRVRRWRARIGPEQARLRVELPARDVDVSARRERRLAKTRVVTLRIHQHARALDGVKTWHVVRSFIRTDAFMRARFCAAVSRYFRRSRSSNRRQSAGDPRPPDRAVARYIDLRSTLEILADPTRGRVATKANAPARSLAPPPARPARLSSRCCKPEVDG